MTLRMTSSCERSVLASGARYYSTARHVRSRHCLYPQPCVAPLESPDYRLPKNRYSNAPLDKLPGWPATACDKWPRYDHRSHKQRLGESLDTERSRSRICWPFSAQMTKARPVPAPSPVYRRAQVPTASRSAAVADLLFFNPTADGVTTHPKGASQPAQRTAFLVSAQDFVAPFRRVGVSGRLLAALAMTVFTQKLLFAIGREAIAHQVWALAVTTVQRDCNHAQTSLADHSSLSHYLRF
jgi:hypothetical protein